MKTKLTKKEIERAQKYTYDSYHDELLEEQDGVQLNYEYKGLSDRVSYCDEHCQDYAEKLEKKGIEYDTHEDCHLLHDKNCDYINGMYYSSDMQEARGLEDLQEENLGIYENESQVFEENKKKGGDEIRYLLKENE